MKDVMVSVRIPNSLVLELKKLAREKHFMDLSEEIRSIIRQNWISNTNFQNNKLPESNRTDLGGKE